MIKRSQYWAISLALLASDVLATDAQYSASAIVTAYDNIRQEQNPTSNEYSTSLRGDFKLIENRVNLTSKLESSLELVNYQNNIVADEAVARLLADATWRVRPNHFEWYISDAFTQTSINSTVNENPSNRQNVNAFSTGPNLIYRISKRNRFELQARAEDFYYEKREADNERSSGLISWVYDLNSSINFSLNYEKENVDFDNNVINSNFDREDGYIQLNYNKQNGTLLLEYGGTEVVDSTGRFNRSSRYLIDYTGARKRNSTTRLVVSRVVSDVSINILNQLNQDYVVDLPDVNSDIYVDNTARLIHTEILKSGMFTINAYRSTNKYVALTNLDQEEKGADLTLDWDLSRKVRLRAQARGLNTVYENFVPYREDDDVFYRLLTIYKAGRNVRLNFEINSFQRESTIGVEEYEDNRAILSLVYTSI